MTHHRYRILLVLFILISVLSATAEDNRVTVQCYRNSLNINYRFSFLKDYLAAGAINATSIVEKPNRDYFDIDVTAYPNQPATLAGVDRPAITKISFRVKVADTTFPCAVQFSHSILKGKNDVFYIHVQVLATGYVDKVIFEHQFSIKKIKFKNLDCYAVLPNSFISDHEIENYMINTEFKEDKEDEEK